MSSKRSSGAQMESTLTNLTEYDRNRAPAELLSEDTEIVVNSASAELQTQFRCPICLEFLKETLTTKNCLHRFCKACITASLRNNNKQCPTCRVKLISKRDLRPDPSFDALIAVLFPDRSQIENMQEQALIAKYGEGKPSGRGGSRKSSPNI